MAAALTVALMLASPANAKLTTLRQETVAHKSPAKPSIAVPAAILIDAERDDVLWSRASRETRYVASTTKIMTAMVALSRLPQDRLITARDYNGAPAESTMNLRAGERLTLRDLLYGLLLPSANDAAYTLAIESSGSVKKFVAAMNGRARALGMRDTVFGNAIGLDSPRNVSSARDMATLARAAMRDERISTIVARPKMRLRSGAQPRTVRNRNRLVGSYAFVDGIKTGRTARAGYVLVGSATRGTGRVISVVLGAGSEAERDAQSLKLLRFGRRHFRQVGLAAPARRALLLPVRLQDRSIGAYPSRIIALSVRNRDRVRLVASTPAEIEGPLKRGTRVGTLRAMRNGKLVASTALVLHESVVEATAAQELADVLGRTLIYLLTALGGLMILIVLRRFTTGRPAREQQVTDYFSAAQQPGAGHRVEQ